MRQLACNAAAEVAVTGDGAGHEACVTIRVTDANLNLTDEVTARRVALVLLARIVAGDGADPVRDIQQNMGPRTECIRVTASHN